jgi:Protein of unknown function (DUF3306)
MSDGFLGRWSRRKLDARDGKPLPPEPAEVASAEAAPAVVEPASMVAPEAVAPQEAAAVGHEPSAVDDQAPAQPPPTLEDVRALTAQSDFSRFAARDVAPEVKNAAMKKLFADPRYNVMDGMDVYIDDYSRPDPIPDSKLRQLASAAFLRIFEEEPAAQEQVVARARDVADNPTTRSVAQSADSAAVPEPDHADPDLRLQQDDAAPGRGPGTGTV